MTYQISTNYSECCLVIKIKTYSTEQMCIVIEDVEQENTMHTNRIATVSGDDCFYVVVVSGVVLKTGQKKEIEAFVKALLYGESEFCKNNDISGYSLELQIWWRDHQISDEKKHQESLKQQKNKIHFR